MHIILTHENADFDAVASLLGAHKLYPDAQPILPDRLNSNAAAFVNLYRNALPFIVRDQWRRRRRITKVTLVDTQKLPSLRGLTDEAHIHIIDHHPLKRDLRPGDTFEGEVIGATTTLLIEKMAERELLLSTLEATLLALGLYEDTGSFSFGRTTARDLQAGAWLITQGADLDTVRRFLDMPLTDEQHHLFEALLGSAEHRTIEGHTVVVASSTTNVYVSEISRVVHRLGDTLDAAALCVLVQTPKGTHLICRSATDLIDVSAITQAFGGGGHTRAAAATIGHAELGALRAAIWAALERETRPAVRVAQLMSYGVQTIDARKHVREVVQQMRRIGHEGFPVVEGDKLVGLLTRRDADRASEHGLGDLRVRDIMQSGMVAVRPDDSIYKLEQVMLQSGWGQIPVLGTHDKLIGIVTRTDLIKQWAQMHPHEVESLPRVDPQQISTVLGENTARLIEAAAELAQAQGVEVYMVGGCVRDLLLNRSNLDLDFVVEGDAIAFADSIRAHLGGSVSSFRPFGTAKWAPDEATCHQLGLDLDRIPRHVDFATARNEIYEHPTALPTVYKGSIKLDLQRRDFTINALALQISPQFGRVLDYYGGLRDLEARQLRVLHSLSFIDDPTRIVRAARFEQRLGFHLEPRTESLIGPALPMLGRITGERIRSELMLLLREPKPEISLLRLQERGVLSAIHPALHMNQAIAALIERIRSTTPPVPGLTVDLPGLYWQVLATTMSPTDAESLCERLMIPRGLRTSIVQAARLPPELTRWANDGLPISEIVKQLDHYDELALLACWIATDHPQERHLIEQYLQSWRHIKPQIDGHRLKTLGLKPGPCYKRILERLRAARLDGEISTEEEENQRVQTLIDEGICDDDVP